MAANGVVRDEREVQKNYWMEHSVDLTVEVLSLPPPNMKRALLLHFLNLFQSKQLGHDHLVVVMQMPILPMLAHAFQNGQSWDVVDPGIIWFDLTSEIMPGVDWLEQNQQKLLMQ